MGADDTQELGLIITGDPSSADNAFKKLNSSIDTMGEKLKKTSEGTHETEESFKHMGANTAKELTHLTHGMDQVIGMFQSGDLIGGIMAFTKVIGTAFHALNVEILVATGGLALVGAALALSFEQSKEEAQSAIENVKKLQEANVEYYAVLDKLSGDRHKQEQAKIEDETDKEIEALNKRFDAQEKVIRQRIEEEGKKKYSAFGGAKDTVEKEVNDALAVIYAERDDLIQKVLDNEQKLVEKSNAKITKEETKTEQDKTNKIIEGKQKQFDAISGMNLKILQAEATNGYDQINIIKQRYVQEFYDLKAKYDKQELTKAQYDEQYALLDKLKHAEIRKEKIKIEDEQNAEDSKRIIEASEAIENIREGFRKSDQLKEQQAWDKKLNATKKFAADFGKALVSGVGHGAEGWKDSLKAITLVILDALEVMVIEANAALAVRAAMGNFTAMLELAGISAAFGLAKVAVNSFQTPEGGSRTVPGGPNVPQLAIVHGGETIGRGSESKGGMSVIVQGNYYESEQANARIYDAMYKYMKRNGLSFSHN